MPFVPLLAIHAAVANANEFGRMEAENAMGCILSLGPLNESVCAKRLPGATGPGKEAARLSGKG